MSCSSLGPRLWVSQKKTDFLNPPKRIRERQLQKSCYFISNFVKQNKRKKWSKIFRLRKKDKKEGSVPNVCPFYTLSVVLSATAEKLLFGPRNIVPHTTHIYLTLFTPNPYFTFTYCATHKVDFNKNVTKINPVCPFTIWLQ